MYKVGDSVRIGYRTRKFQLRGNTYRVETVSEGPPEVVGVMDNGKYYRVLAEYCTPSDTPPPPKPLPTAEAPEEAPAKAENNPMDLGQQLGQVIAQSVFGNLDARVNAVIEQIDGKVDAAVKARVPTNHTITLMDKGEPRVAIQGHPHKSLQTLVNWCNLGQHIAMVGPAGGGKTTAASQAAKLLGIPYYEQSVGPTTSAWDLTGWRSPDGTYVPGILRKPYQEGGLLLLDEVDNGNPSVLTVLNSALANGHYTFPDGVAVQKHPNFRMVTGANTYGRGADRLYVGRNQLDAAFLDRFAVLTWDYDEQAESIWAGEPGDWVKHVQKLRHAAWELKLRVVISPRASINGAQAIRAGIPRDEVLEAVVWRGLDKDTRAKLERA